LAIRKIILGYVMRRRIFTYAFTQSIKILALWHLQLRYVKVENSYKKQHQWRYWHRRTSHPMGHGGIRLLVSPSVCEYILSMLTFNTLTDSTFLLKL